mmetsp:Transcript_8481/g.9991  ORF Transcript_8481/g.9991 Transcript_8481/m.9991 type:complete len:251 (-) Transcript_8481:374-1126(-)|eukprot:CAMPEP_0204826962 /NCGR_PEP_ID=MMETSP1346-20131115/4548_1 /ASSEMBLY_ACC=CAM_ASM_000771 /TAXON_ID=215587 /ORGANISM="Aplanochytrium stocchinoi, Strain GSBS06" /LENGTH=250 /DNA_ID=CAMNT_0051955215 /DNA_START=121 /DNA_END=873 /DNA_ORIENTATION=-
MQVEERRQQEHLLLQAFGPSIWTVDGPEVSFFGFPYPTRMVICNLADGSSWVWSPIALTDQLYSEMKGMKLDRVEHIVSPNKIHHIFLKQWQEKFPHACFYSPPGLSCRKVVEGVRFDKELDYSDGNSEKHAFYEDIEQVIFHGSFFMEEVVFFHKLSKTVIFGDLIQRFPESDARGWKGMLMWIDGLVGKRGSTPREWRLSFMCGKDKARAALNTVLEEWKPEQLVIAHGECVADGTATEVVRDALSWI